LHTTAAPPPNTILRGAPPQSAGVFRCPQTKLLGTLAAPGKDGTVDITTAYAGAFGAPVVGERVFVQVNALNNGLEGLRLTFSARVPAAA